MSRRAAEPEATPTGVPDDRRGPTSRSPSTSTTSRAAPAGARGRAHGGRRARDRVSLASALELPVEDVARPPARAGGGVCRSGSAASPLRSVAGGWRVYSRSDFAPVVEKFVLDGQQAKLTQASLETLAVIAYRQPSRGPGQRGPRRQRRRGRPHPDVTAAWSPRSATGTRAARSSTGTTPYFLQRHGARRRSTTCRRSRPTYRTLTSSTSSSRKDAHEPPVRRAAATAAQEGVRRRQRRRGPRRAGGGSSAAAARPSGAPAAQRPGGRSGPAAAAGQQRHHQGQPAHPASRAQEPAGPPIDVHDPDGVRLQKLLAAAGVGTPPRLREPHRPQGRVEVDGQVVTELGVRIDPDRRSCTSTASACSSTSHASTSPSTSRWASSRR